MAFGSAAPPLGAPFVARANHRNGGAPRWDFDFFLRRFGDRSIPVDGLACGKREPLQHLIAKLRDATRRPAPYVRNVLLPQHLPELCSEFCPPSFARPNWLESRALADYSGGSWRRWVELFLSAPKTRFPYVHIDPYYTHAWSVQLSGKKHFWLWEPTPNQFAQICHGVIPRKNPTLITPQTSLRSFFEDRAPQHHILEAGDCLFIPAGWWHTTETEEESVTLGGNFVNATNWKQFRFLYDKRNPPHSRRQAALRAMARHVAPAYLRSRYRAPSKGLDAVRSYRD